MANATNMEYVLEQRLKNGSMWRSEPFSGTDREARQAVIAGFLAGEPRRALRLDGRVIYALDEKGREVR